MNTSILMILLIMGENGQVESSFSKQEDMKSCGEMAAGIQEVFSQTGIEVRKLDCVASSQKFSEFKHNVPRDAPRHHYLIDYRPGSPRVVAVVDQAECRDYKASIPAEEEASVICTISPQRLYDASGTTPSR